MNNLPVRLGPFHCTAGSWVPRGNPTGVFRFKNPFVIHRGVLLAARVFVGLYVNGEPKWTKSQVIERVRRTWKHEASFISQDGLWTDRGVLKPEKSIQVVILNIDGNGNPIHKTRKAFEVAVEGLAVGLQKSFRQDLVVVDFQANGRTVGTGLAT